MRPSLRIHTYVSLGAEILEYGGTAVMPLASNRHVRRGWENVCTDCRIRICCCGDVRLKVRRKTSKAKLSHAEAGGKNLYQLGKSFQVFVKTDRNSLPFSR